MKRITLAMCVYDDFDGVYFTCQGNRLLHPILEQEGEILVIDNNPDSRRGRATRFFCENSGFARYMQERTRKGTAVRNLVFEHAQSEIVICVDCHVLLAAGAIEAVVRFFEEDSGNSPLFIQGPHLHDNLVSETRFWRRIWAGGLFGRWNEGQPLSEKGSGAYEFGFSGLGAFAARRSEWPGFHPLFRGFGGEEGYIHDKYRRAGGRVLGLPEFKWAHRYGRPDGPPYSARYSDRIYNYFVGAFELGQRPDRIIEYFSSVVSEPQVRALFDEAWRDYTAFESVYREHSRDGRSKE